MRAVLVIVILGVVGFFGYEYAVNGRLPHEALRGAPAAPAADEAAPAQ